MPLTNLISKHKKRKPTTPQYKTIRRIKEHMTVPTDIMNEDSHLHISFTI